MAYNDSAPGSLTSRYLGSTKDVSRNLHGSILQSLFDTPQKHAGTHTRDISGVLLPKQYGIHHGRVGQTQRIILFQKAV